MTDSNFPALGLNAELCRAVADAGYRIPTPVQQQAIPPALAGRDVLATAQTGTGKTAAFALPILQRLTAAPPRARRPVGALILTPTRELALQIEENLVLYGRHLPATFAVVLGGVPAPPQIRALKRKPDVVVATPGRLLDLMQQGYVDLSAVETFVLDEADRMLDMGFIRDVKRIAGMLPERHQTLFFSATFSPAIQRLADGMLRDPVRIDVAPNHTVADNIEQRVMFVAPERKRELLLRILRQHPGGRILVFTRTRRRADRLARQLAKSGVAADALHSDKTQGARQRTLAAFDGGKTRVLVATDIVSRGIDVEGISHVINYELPDDPENYVHRIGRTARAGAAGVALSFCGTEEVDRLRSIERLIRSTLEPSTDHPFHDPVAERHNERKKPVRSTRAVRRSIFRKGRAAGGLGRRIGR